MTDDDKALVSKIRSEAELQKHYDGLLHMQMTLWADRIEALSAENERLRRHLREIAAECVVTVGTDQQMYSRWRAIAVKRVDIARAALGDTE